MSYFFIVYVAICEFLGLVSSIFEVILRFLFFQFNSTLSLLEDRRQLKTAPHSQVNRYRRNMSVLGLCRGETLHVFHNMDN